MSSARTLKLTLFALLAVTIGFKFILQGNSLTPSRPALLAGLSERARTGGLDVSGVVEGAARPFLLVRSGDCVINITTVPVEGAFEELDRQLLAAGERLDYVFEGEALGDTAPRWRPAIYQQAFKLMKSMGFNVMFPTIYITRHDAQCALPAPLLEATKTHLLAFLPF